MATAIVIKLELGHIAQIKDVPLPSGHTHDWMVFVKGADGMNIEHFVDKVVFWLHDSYDPPKYVARYPPYQVKQSGYAGFNLLIDIHFKITSDPKYVRFHYDLFLNHENMPPVNHTRVEMLTFNNPVEEFKRRLLRAGGELKTVDVKEKKSSKKSHRKEASKQSRSNKERNDHDKVKSKPHRADVKPPKHQRRSEEKRRNSVGDAEIAKRKKNEEKPVGQSNSTNNADLKVKEKANKPKIKMDDSVAASLFPREENIDVKKVKKKEVSLSKKDDQRRGKERRSETKFPKQEKSETVPKPEKSERKKKERKSPDLTKQNPVEEFKPKKRPPRPVSSDSDSDIGTKRQPAILSDSDSDIQKTKKKRKLETLDRIKSKKSNKKERGASKKLEKRSAPDVSSRDHRSIVTGMDVSQTPPSDHSTSQTTKGKHHNSIEVSSKDKKSKSKPSSDKTRVTPSGIKIHIKDVKKETPPPPPPSKNERERESYRSGTPSSKGRGSSSERKVVKPLQQQLPGRKDMKMMDSSGSSDESDIDEEHSPGKDLFKNPVSPMSVSSASSLSSSIREVPQFDNAHEDEDPVDHSNYDLPMSPGHFADDSDGESRVFESPNHSEGQLDTSAESNIDNKQMVHSEQEEAVENEQVGRPLRIEVGTGTTLNVYPDVTEEIFEELRELQMMLATITDFDASEKIVSIVRRSGSYDMDGDVMNFDLCSLSKKTIRKLKRHLNAINR